MVSSVVTRTAVQADSGKTPFQLKAISPGDGSGDSVTHALVDGSSNVINPGTHEDLVALLTKNESIRAILAGILSIQGTVTANLGTLNGAASDAVLGQILGAIKAQIDVAPLFVTDGTNTYVRRERVNEGTGVITVEFEGMDGTIVSLTASQVAALSPITSKSRVATPVYYDVLVAGTGFGVQDTVAEIVITDTVTGALTTTWQNLSQGTTIAAPLNTSVRKQVNGVSIMSQSAGLALDTSVQQLVASIGSVGDLATASTLVGLLKAILSRTPGLGAAAAAASSPVALATDQLAVIAKDSSVQQLVSVIGSTSDLATALTVVGNLKAIAAKLDSGLQNDTTALNAITAQATREGALATNPPEAFPAGASGKLGALNQLWAYSKGMATSLAAMLAALLNADFSGSLSASGNISGPLGTFATQSIVLAGNAIGTLTAIGSVKIDGSIYEIPLKIRAYGSSSVAVDSLTATAAGGFNGAYFVETAGLDGVQFQFAWTSGTLTYRGTASKMTKSMRVHAPKTDAPWVTTTPAGASGDFALPTLANAYGTTIGVAPVGATKGASIFMPPGSAISWTTQPIGTVYSSGSPAPAGVTKTFTNSLSVPQWVDEQFDPALMTMFLTQVNPGTGGLLPIGRWM